MWRTVPAELMPIVVDQAVPSEVQSTVGSEGKESPRPVCTGRLVCHQVAPLLVEKNIDCPPLPLMLFEAPMIFVGSLKLIRMSDSLRGEVWAPEIRSSPVSEAARVRVDLPGRPFCRSWWASIHSWTSFRT